MGKKSRMKREGARALVENAGGHAVGGMAAAASWPVLEALLSDGWDRQGALASILIARHNPITDRVAVGLFLVDLACLGIKSAQVKLYRSVDEYMDGLRAHAMRIQRMSPADFNLVAKILFTGLQYADSLGFRPDPVWAQAEPLLADAQPEASAAPVPTGGADGKPFYISGPHDDPRRVLAQLTKAVGEGNFHFMLGAGAVPSDLD